MGGGLGGESWRTASSVFSDNLSDRRQEVRLHHRTVAHRTALVVVGWVCRSPVESGRRPPKTEIEKNTAQNSNDHYLFPVVKPGQLSVRKGSAGSPALLQRFPSGVSPQS